MKQTGISKQKFLLKAKSVHLMIYRSENTLLRIFFFISIMFFSSISVYAQTFRVFNIMLDQIGLEYKSPTGFAEMDSVYNFFFYTSDDNPRKRKYLYPFTYRLQSNNNVLIGFSIHKIDPKLDSLALLKSIFPGRTENTEYLLPIKHKADTSNGKKVVFYSDYKSEKMFHATKAGTYSFKLEVPYEGKYNLCKIVFLHKYNHGHGEVYYFYNERGEWLVKKLLKNTNKMIRFKN